MAKKAKPLEKLDFSVIQQPLTGLGGWHTLKPVRRFWVAHPLRFCLVRRVGNSSLRHAECSGCPIRRLRVWGYSLSIF